MATNPEFRPGNLTFPFEKSQSEDDWALVGKHTLSYAGPYTFTDDSTNVSGTLVHGPLKVANVPSWVGTYQKRNYTIFHGQGNALVIRLYSQRYDGSVGELWWQKMPDLVGLT